MKLYTPIDPPTVRVAPGVVGVVAKWNASYLVAGFCCVVSVLPIAFVAGPQPWRWIGIVYATLWVVAMVPSSNAYLLVIFDSILFLLNREPLALLRIFAALSNGVHSDRPKVEGLVRRASKISMLANPLAN